MLRLFLFLLVLLQDLSGFQDSCTLVSGQTPDIFVLSFRCIPHQDRFTLHLKGASNQTTPGTPQICRIKEIVKLLGMLLQISPKMFEHLPDKTLRTCMMCVSGTSMKLLEQNKNATNFWLKSSLCALNSQYTEILPAPWQAAVVMDVQPRAGKSIFTRRPWRFSTCTNRPILKPKASLVEKRNMTPQHEYSPSIYLK